MAADPPKTRELFLFITRAAILRNRALLRLAGRPERSLGGCGLADDSIQLIGTDMYRELVMPAHELWYREMSDTTVASRNRSIHLCGDATRHFPTLVEELGVTAFDTGFPVDHGALRRRLGPAVHLAGGPRVALLRDGTPAQCYDEARRILLSGVMEGGRFSLREGNNLPPGVPLENLQAVYAACLDHGWYRKPVAPGEGTDPAQ
jgi:uroporphyrinogen-III decarboxylase